jgi:hypothetical protein
MRFLILFLLVLCAPAQADSIARQGSDWVRVTALPCADEAVRAQITLVGEDPADYRAANAEFAGQPYSACWRPMMQQRVILVRYSDGDGSLIDFGALQPLKDV